MRTNDESKEYMRDRLKRTAYGLAASLFGAVLVFYGRDVVGIIILTMGATFVSPKTTLAWMKSIDLSGVLKAITSSKSGGADE